MASLTIKGAVLQCDTLTELQAKLTEIQNNPGMSNVTSDQTALTITFDFYGT